MRKNAKLNVLWDDCGDCVGVGGMCRAWVLAWMDGKRRGVGC